MTLARSDGKLEVKRAVTAETPCNRVSKSTGRKPSLWVPGSGSGSNFSYNPGAKTGMKLSGRFVPGQHMFEKSLPDTKEDLRKITKSEVERLFRALF